MKSLGYVIHDATWNRLVRWVDVTDGQPAALWCAEFDKGDGPTLFKTKRAARKAITETRKLIQYAWSSNNYVIYEVHS